MSEQANSYLLIEENLLMLESVQEVMFLLLENQNVDKELKTIFYGLVNTMEKNLDEIKSKLKAC